jgi:hypothetical protein
MNKKLPRTCNGCRALGASTNINSCSLRFNNRGEYMPKFGITRLVPQEPCYKPMTIAELFEAQNARNNEVQS